jgi:hypothetical protein
MMEIEGENPKDTIVNAGYFPLRAYEEKIIVTLS